MIMVKRWVAGLALGLSLLAGLSLVQAQGDQPTKEFSWEEYGVTLTIPEDWTVETTPTDRYDLALVSPEAASSGQGSFMTWRYFPSLGPDVTPTSALESVADQVSGTVEPVTVAGIEGAHVASTQEGTQFDSILFPYGDLGGVFFIQAAAVEGETETMQAMLDSIQVEPPHPDEDAINAAWQASLADKGTLEYGSADAPIKMVEVLSMTCGHCANYSHAISRLLALEVEPGNVHLQWALIQRNDLDTNANRALFCAAEQGKGYTAYKALWQGYFNQGPEEAYTNGGINDLLGAVGVDVDALNECKDSGKYDAAQQAAEQIAAEAGVTGTPSVLLAQDGEQPQLLIFPDGQKWGGVISVGILRDLFAKVRDEGLTFQQAANVFFGLDPDFVPTAEAADQSSQAPGAVSSSDDGSGDSTDGGNGASESQATKDTASGDNDSTMMYLVAGAVLLVGVLAFVAVLVSRRGTPAPAVPPADTPSEAPPPNPM